MQKMLKYLQYCNSVYKANEKLGAERRVQIFSCVNKLLQVV